MAVRTVTVTLRMNAVQFLTNGRAVVRVNGDMSDSFRRLTTDATAADHAMNGVNRNLRQLSARARLAENRVRELREEINRLTVAALAANGPVNVIAGPGGGGGMGGRGGGLFGMVRAAWNALPQQVKIAIASAALAMATMLVTALGAMVGALMTLVLGAVITAGLVAIAAKTSDAVQHAFMGVFRPVVADLKLFAEVGIDPLVRTAHDFGEAWMRIGPQVREMFVLMADSIRPLGQGLTGFLEGAMPGLTTALRNAGPIIRQFARDMPAVGREFGNMFAQMSRGQGVMKGMRAFMMLLAGTFRFLGNTIHGLAVGFDFLTRNGEKMTRFLSHIPVIGFFADKIADVLHTINDAGKEAAGGEGEAADAAEDMAVSSARAAAATMSLDKAVAGLNTRLDEQVRRMNGTLDARLAFEESLLALKKSIQDNGRTLDEHTAKGIENTRMLDGAARAAYAKRDAFIEANTATLGLARATEIANAQFNVDIARIYALGKAMGLTRAQIDGLVGAYYGIVNAPNVEKLITFTIRTRGDRTFADSAYQTPSGVVRHSSHEFNREGGLHMARRGLVNLNAQAQMFRPGHTMYGFAEAGTGGEAFIARNADHGRSLAIANQAAAWHGGRVVTGGGGGGHTTRSGPVVGVGAGNGAGIATRAVLDLLKYAFNGPIRATVDAGGRVRIT